MAQGIEKAATACTDLEADLILLHYGDLDGTERARLQSHVAQCADCSAYLNELSALMPLTVATDSPPQQFWMDYSRELRHKIDARVESKFSWQQVVALLKPGYLTALATAATLIIALTFTLGGGLWSSKNDLPDEELTEALPVAENLDFFRAMDVLDELDLLEVMGNSANDAA
jgi:anti-sigma factor RsiW